MQGLMSENGMRVTSQHTGSIYASSASSRFERRPVLGMPPRIESYCVVCKKFVAAGDKLAVLRIAEDAHICATPKSGLLSG
jgi:hypothetical protein